MISMHDTPQNTFTGTAAEDFGSWLNDISGVTATNAFNAAEAQKQRDYDERMSNTTYQRSVKDMLSAGLNPATLVGGSMSAVSNGSGAAATGSGNGKGALSAFLNAAGNLIKVAAVVAK